MEHSSCLVVGFVDVDIEWSQNGTLHQGLKQQWGVPQIEINISDELLGRRTVLCGVDRLESILIWDADIIRMRSIAASWRSSLSDLKEFDERLVLWILQDLHVLCKLEGLDRVPES